MRNRIDDTIIDAAINAQITSIQLSCLQQQEKVSIYLQCTLLNILSLTVIIVFKEYIFNFLNLRQYFVLKFQIP